MCICCRQQDSWMKINTVLFGCTEQHDGGRFRKAGSLALLPTCSFLHVCMCMNACLKWHEYVSVLGLVRMAGSG